MRHERGALSLCTTLLLLTLEPVRRTHEQKQMGSEALGSDALWHQWLTLHRPSGLMPLSALTHARTRIRILCVPFARP